MTRYRNSFLKCSLNFFLPFLSWLSDYLYLWLSFHSSTFSSSLKWIHELESLPFLHPIFSIYISANILIKSLKRHLNYISVYTHTRNFQNTIITGFSKCCLWTTSKHHSILETVAFLNTSSCASTLYAGVR